MTAPDTAPASESAPDTAHTPDPPPASVPSPAAPPAQTERRAPISQRTPFLAGVLSAIMPGFGNVYNGFFTRGLLNFLIFFSLFFTAAQTDGGPALALLIPAMIFTWLFGIVDAYRNATLINLGVSRVDLQETLPDLRQSSGGGMAVGVALFLIGLYGLLTQAFDIDLSFVFDYWYVLLMVLGGWMIFHGWKSRQAEAEED